MDKLMNSGIYPNSRLGSHPTPFGITMAACTEMFAKVLRFLFAIREKEEGYTRSQLARDIGISPSAVTKLFRGKTLPSAETLDKLSAVFGVPVHRWFLPPDENEERRITPEDGLRLYLKSKGYILKSISRPKVSVK